MTELEPDRKKKFVEETIREYLSSLRVDRYLKNVPIDEAQAGGGLRQIGLRTKVGADVFSPQPIGGRYVSSRVVGLGRAIGIGENEYFITCIIKDPHISPVPIKKSDFTPDKLSEIIADMGARIFLPVSLKFELLRATKWRGALNFSGHTLKFDSYPVFSAPDKVMNNKIIVLNGVDSTWEYVHFKNKITGTKERLDIEIGEELGREVEVRVRSMVNPKIGTFKILQLI